MDRRLWSLLVIALVELFVIGLFVQLFPFLVRLTRRVPLPANLGLQPSCGVSFPPREWNGRLRMSRSSG